MDNFRIGRHILDTAHQVKVVLDAAFGEANLNNLQVRILGFVQHNDELGKDVYQKDIESEFKIRRSSVTSVLNTMEKNGFIVRQSVVSDARLKKIALTEKAKNVGRAHWQSIENYERILVDNMTPEEILTLASLLDKVLVNINNIRGDKDD